MKVRFHASDMPGRDIWRASAETARTFKGNAEVLAEIFGVDSGVGDLVNGECVIDFGDFSKLSAITLDRFSASGQGILRSLTLGFIATSLVLIDRSGHTAPAMPGPDQERAWTALRDQHARAMPI
ncbi:DUF6086 family protein [Streptomyces sp. NPDC001393]